MAKHLFTDAFQTALQQEIQCLLNQEWCLAGFSVKTECSTKDMMGLFTQFVDIGIKDEDNEYGFVGIEIEHISEFAQAKENIQKLKRWAHHSPKRKCGLLQLFNEECRITENQLCALQDFADENRRKGYGFFYEYGFYRLRGRLPQTVAREIAASKEFRTRLYQLLKYTGSCRQP